MTDWKSAPSMVKNLHSDYAKVQMNWKKSSEHKEATDVLHGMLLDILADKTMEEEEKQQFVVSNQKCLYYFLMMAQYGAHFFTAITASMPEGIEFDLGKPRVARATGHKFESGKPKAARATGRKKVRVIQQKWR
jgi:hypothetical protein